MELYHVDIWLPVKVTPADEKILKELAQSQSTKSLNWYVINGRRNESTGDKLMLSYRAEAELDNFQIMLLKLTYPHCEINSIYPEKR